MDEVIHTENWTAATYDSFHEIAFESSFFKNCSKDV